MELIDIALLLATGFAAGFLAGLIGVGGGIIFAPVLLFYFQSEGVAADIVAPLTVGSSLMCTLVAAVASAWFQGRKDAVNKHVAVRVGLFSAVAIVLMTYFVTTRPWYDARAFQVVFSLLLLAVVGQMLLGKRPAGGDEPTEPKTGWPGLAITGSVAGVVASAAGVGGGIVLVPAYNTLLKLPMLRAVGTSSATIVLISLFGVATYALMGLGASSPPTAIGYVDARALFLALPAVVSARLGVSAAHRVNRRVLQLSFAALALLVAGRLLWDALAG